MFLQTQLFGIFTHLFTIQFLTFLRAFVFFVFTTVFFGTFFATIRWYNREHEAPQIFFVRKWSQSVYVFWGHLASYICDWPLNTLRPVILHQARHNHQNNAIAPWNHRPDPCTGEHSRQMYAWLLAATEGCICLCLSPNRTWHKVNDSKVG